MKRLILLVILGLLTASFSFVHAAQPPQYAVHESVNLAPSSPHLTAVDPFANGLTPSNPLKPARPFWYSVDKNGLTIVGLRTETTGALMVGGPPIDVVENQVVGYVPWPDAFPITQPDGEVPTDPTVTADHNKFAWRATVGDWEPVGIIVSYPTDEALASNSETPATYVYVVMKHSGYEWQSTPQAELPAGRDPNLRDKIVPQADLNKDGSLLVQVDVSQPNYPVDLFPTGPAIGGGLLGHNAGQPAFDPASDTVYVGSMPSTSLPTTPQVPNDLTSFVSVLTLAPGELPVPGEPPAPVTITVLCGPEHAEIAILAGVPQAWACIAEGGEGPFQWTFTNLPGWLAAHVDPISGQGDGILYGTPSEGTWTFQAHVDDNATTPPGTGDATITLTVTSDPATEYEYGELEWGVGTPAAVAIEGTLKSGDPCALAPTTSPGSMVPAWVDVVQIPGRTIDNTAMGGPVENTIGCVIMGTAPISGERYEFQMPNLQFTWPSQNLPIVISGQVLGPYTFNPLPPGVTLSGLAWHQIDKIHDASTEADLLNREFFGVEPYTGQMYRILPAYAGLEVAGTIVPPPALEGEMDEVSTYVTSAEMLTALKTARPDIAAVLDANPNLKVKFGDLVVEASPNANVFVTAREIFDPTGADPTVTPIGGPLGSPLPIGALIKVSGNRDAEDPAVITLSVISTIDLPGVQAYSLGLNSDLRPAVPGSEPGQVDNGVLWVTGTNTGNVEVVDTALAKYAQLLTVPDATSLGGVSVYPTTGFAYVAGESLLSVIHFGPGTPPATAPVIWSNSTTTFFIGAPGSFKVIATGSPMPTLSETGALPSGVTFVDNGDGTATLAGTPGVVGSFPFTITASNGNPRPDAIQNFTLTVVPGVAPAITSASTTTFTVGSPGSFTVTATGAPTPTLSETGALPGGVTFTDNGDGTATLAGTPGAVGSFPFTITASNGAPRPDAIQNFTLTVAGIAPVITSANTTTFTVGAPGSFTVTATGTPTPALSETGTLPGGVTFTDNGDGTATLAGTPGAAGSYPFTITASNGAPRPDATQNFTLTVNPSAMAPVITSSNTTTFTVGSPGSFTVTATGTPTPALYETGALPGGVTFTDNGNGTATLAGTTGAAGSYPFTITAWNGVLPNATQNFTLTVNSSGGNAAQMTTPVPGSVLTSSTVTFTWNTGVGVSEYYLQVGTTPGGYDLWGYTNGTSLSRTVGGLPTNGSTIYVRLWSMIEGVYQCNDYSYTTATYSKAVMTTPTPGSTLTSSTEIFTWTAGSGATQYYLQVGTTAGGSDIWGYTNGTALTRTVGGLPTNGITIYVRLWSVLEGVWQYNDCSYTAVNFSKAVMTDPTPGTTLTGSVVTFTWNAGAGATQYYLQVGTTAGGSDIWGYTNGTSLSRTVGGLPTSGSTVYVRLWSMLEGVWQFNDYSYSTASYSTAVMSSPTPGSTLTSSMVTFTWSAGAGATQYYLQVGTTPGGADIWGYTNGTDLTKTVGGLPTNGSAVYVRLWSMIEGQWQFNDYTYTACTGCQ